jgi:hypothetical protein
VGHDLLRLGVQRAGGEHGADAFQVLQQRGITAGPSAGE